MGRLANGFSIPQLPRIEQEMEEILAWPLN